MTIRHKLVIWVAALFTVVLLAAGAASVLILRAQLVGEIDAVLVERSSFIADVADQDVGFPRPDGPPGVPFPAASDMAAVITDSSGSVVFSVPSGRSDEPDPLPNVTQLDPTTTDGSAAQIEEIGSVEAGGPTYRALATLVQDGALTVVLAVPLDNARATIQNTTVTLAFAGAIAVVALGGLVWWAIRAGLRPIDDMIDAAGHIGAGDLSHRVPTAEPDTEVGHLAIALNSMLSQIESAVDAKTESEAHMRQFLSDTSHELRTPLTSIRGYAELHRHGATSPEEIDRAFNRIESEATRMGTLVDDLLLLARLDQHPSLAAIPIDITRLVNNAVDDAAAAEPGRPITLEIDEGDTVVTGDENRLRQAIDNVLANARHHTPPGTPIRVTITQSHDTATIEVADTGPGMTEEAAAKAFERFYQANPNRSGAGSGLGLPIVQAIIEAHSGEVVLATAPGAGTTVTVRVPIGAPPAH